jgi:DNA helicase II / ATP-dependent DNA helicase PcrA
MLPATMLKPCDSQALPRDDFLSKLNGEQRAAVEMAAGVHGRPAGPLLIIAGAGTGKTNTLAHLVAKLMVDGADPRRILLLTFSRRAAKELIRRVERIAAEAMGSAVGAMAESIEWAGTFHAVGARLLRDHAHSIGLAPDFTIHDREDSADLMNLVRHELGFSDLPRRFPMKGTCLAIYSRTVNATSSLEDVLETAYPWCIEWADALRSLFGAYVEAKQRQNVLDYDDLLLWWAQMMAVPEFARSVGGRFDHVLVDEYQDTNRLQAAILLSMKPDGNGLTVVGDDAQSIYSFRSAEIRNILDFPESFSVPVSIVTLERNYRSTQPILAAANAVIGLAAERHSKKLWSERTSSEKPQLVTVADEAGQADYVVKTILAAREEGISLRSQAVLFRTSHHSGPLEVELTRRNIPYVKFGGLKFLEAAHIKDVLAALRWAGNPRDRVTGFRLLQVLPGIGPATAGKVVEMLEANGGRLRSLADYPPPARATEAWREFLEMISGLGTSSWPAELECIRLWYEPHLARIYEDAAVRRADLLQLEHIAAGYPTRERFLTELTLDPPEATSDEAGAPQRDDDYLILSTIHSAKGQEWKSVFVLNAVDGCIPSDLGTGTTAALEEERRLLYVAMTRAKDHLHLIVPQRFFTHGQASHGDRHVYAGRTRFIPDSILDCFACLGWPVTGPANTGRTANQAIPVDLRQQMRDMWR